MTATASATLLDPGRWTGKIFNGEWIPSGGGERTVVEPAKGAKLGAAGMASVDDVRRAAERAAEAQREWARLPFLARAAVRAAQLWQENAGKLVDWIVCESGAIGRSRASNCTSLRVSAGKPRRRRDPRSRST
jgi:benzaldehyde dehydrogenase (NAD)